MDGKLEDVTSNIGIFLKFPNDQQVSLQEVCDGEDSASGLIISGYVDLHTPSCSEQSSTKVAGSSHTVQQAWCDLIS